jgi:hypothetical protein
MRRRLSFAMALLLSGCIVPATAQQCFPTAHGQTSVRQPDRDSSQQSQVSVKPNFQVFQRFKSAGDLPVGSPPFAGYFFETPASIACVYSLVPQGTTCNPNTVTGNPTGGSQSIAIVEPYDDPYAGPDLSYFSAQFGLPFSTSQFQVVFAGGLGLRPTTRDRPNCGRSQKWSGPMRWRLTPRSTWLKQLTMIWNS